MVFETFLLTLTLTSAAVLCSNFELDDEDLEFLRPIQPSVSFRHGDYYGQTLLSESGDDEKVAHGMGSYIGEDGKVLYAGEWFRGRMHGQGQRYFSSGANYTGHFHHSQLQGRGQLDYPNGTRLWGDFRHNRAVGKALMEYPNGDRRKGVLGIGMQPWVGSAVFVEGSDGTLWKEFWGDGGNYTPAVKIFKKVENNYTDVKVEVVCKAHGLNPHVRLYKEDELMTTATVETSGEIAKISLKIPFSDDAFKVYTCRTEDDSGNIIEDKLQVRNPFFIQSHGECGIQFVEAKLKRDRRSSSSSSSSARVVGGRTAHRGQVPWQAILHVTYKSMGDYCGGTIISPWHVLTAAHCLTTSGLDRFFAPSELKVKVGYTTRPNSINGQVIEVARRYLHPDYNHVTLFNDVAVLVLRQKIVIGKYVNPVCLPKENHEALESEELTSLIISGFGLTFNLSDLEREWHFPSHLQVGTVHHLNISECFAPQHELARQFQGHFCAGESGKYPGRDFRVDSCAGDSGGPVTYRDKINGRHYLMGLVSAGPRVCGAAGQGGAVYVNVSHYVRWVTRVRLLDLVREYQMSQVVPYEKVDSPIFRAMFDFLKGVREDSILGGKEHRSDGSERGERSGLEDEGFVDFEDTGEATTLENPFE